MNSKDDPKHDKKIAADKSSLQILAASHSLIKKFAALLVEQDLSEIDAECHGLRLRVSRSLPIVAGNVTAPPLAPVQPAAAKPIADPALTEITAPVVGIVYLAPEPSAEHYVREGDHVTKGQVCMIIEAMKVMNSITAPRAGIIESIRVINEQPVEFGELLFVMR